MAIGFNTRHCKLRESLITWPRKETNIRDQLECVKKSATANLNKAVRGDSAERSETNWKPGMHSNQRMGGVTRVTKQAKMHGISMKKPTCQQLPHYLRLP